MYRTKCPLIISLNPPIQKKLIAEVLAVVLLADDFAHENQYLAADSTLHSSTAAAAAAAAVAGAVVVAVAEGVALLMPVLYVKAREVEVAAD